MFATRYSLSSLVLLSLSISPIMAQQTNCTDAHWVGVYPNATETTAESCAQWTDACTSVCSGASNSTSTAATSSATATTSTASSVVSTTTVNSTCTEAERLTVGGYDSIMGYCTCSDGTNAFSDAVSSLGWIATYCDEECFCEEP